MSPGEERGEGDKACYVILQDQGGAQVSVLSYGIAHSAG